MSGMFDDIFGPVPPGMDSLRATGKPKEEKGIAWEAKVIDGKYYVPLNQVAQLLALNKVLPKVAEGIRRRVAKGPES